MYTEGTEGGREGRTEEGREGWMEGEREGGTHDNRFALVNVKITSRRRRQREKKRK